MITDTEVKLVDTLASQYRPHLSVMIASDKTLAKLLHTTPINIKNIYLDDGLALGMVKINDKYIIQLKYINDIRTSTLNTEKKLQYQANQTKRDQK